MSDFKKIKWVVLALMLIGIGGGSYAYLAQERKDPEVEHVKELGKQFFDSKSDLTLEEKAEIGKQIHEEVKNLPEDKQAKLREDGREHFAKMFLERHLKEVERAEKFFEIDDKQEQVKALDAYIDEQEQEFQRWRKMAELMRGVWGGNRGSAGDAKTGGDAKSGDAKSGEQTGEKKPEENKNRMWKPPTEEEKENFRRKLLDSTTAEQRAKHTDYLRQLDARRIERGLQSLKDMRFGRGSRQ